MPSRCFTPFSLLQTQYLTSKGVSIALHGQAAALDFLRSKDLPFMLHMRPIFVPSKGRADIAHLNYDLKGALAGFRHVVVVVVSREEV